MGRAIVIILTLAWSALGATYYVDPVAGNDSNDGLATNTAWLTIGRATDTGYPHVYRSAGDTVYLRGGLYSGNTHSISLGSDGNPGSNGAPITIAAYPGETPIVCDITSPYRPIMLYRTGWWVFDGITYSNNYQNTWLKSITNSVWKNCSFGWSPPDCGYAGFQLFDDVATNSGCRFNVISNCVFRNWGEITAACNDNGVAISIGNADVDSPDSYNLIISNSFRGSAHSHIEVYSPFNVVRGNTFVNEPWLVTNASCYTMSIGQTVETNIYGAYGNRHMKPGDGGTSQLDYRNVFDHNTFLYSGPPPDDDGAFGVEFASHWCVFRYNTIAYSLAAGLCFSTASATAYVTSNSIYGNVIFRCGLANTYGGAGMKAFDFGLTMIIGGQRTNNYIVNNILWGNAPSNAAPEIFTQQHYRTNWNGDDLSCTDPLFYGTNGLQFLTNATDWFECYNATNVPDFRLQTNSPCIDAGTWLAFVTSESGSGTTMAVDNSLYFSDGNRIVTGDTIQLQGQTSTAIISSNDWQNNVLYLSSPLTWTNGQGVSLPYNGAAPDMGAYETEGEPEPPASPTGRKTMGGGTYGIGTY